MPIDAPTGSTPTVVGSTVFVPTYAGEIFAFGMPGVEIQWRFHDTKLSDELKNSIAVQTD